MQNEEKSDGNSSVTLSLSLGIFEFLNRNIVNELKERKEVEVTVKKAPRAPTDLFGDAIAEKQGVAKFHVKDQNYEVNYTMYNTGTCNMFLQKSPTIIKELGNKTISEY